MDHRSKRLWWLNTVGKIEKVRSRVKLLLEFYDKLPIYILHCRDLLTKCRLQQHFPEV